MPDENKPDKDGKILHFDPHSEKLTKRDIAISIGNNIRGYGKRKDHYQHVKNLQCFEKYFSAVGNHFIYLQVGKPISWKACKLGSQFLVDKFRYIVTALIKNYSEDFASVVCDLVFYAFCYRPTGLFSFQHQDNAVHISRDGYTVGR